MQVSVSSSNSKITHPKLLRRVQSIYKMQITVISAAVIILGTTRYSVMASPFSYIGGVVGESAMHHLQILLPPPPSLWSSTMVKTVLTASVVHHPYHNNNNDEVPPSPARVCPPNYPPACWISDFTEVLTNPEDYEVDGRHCFDISPQRQSRPSLNEGYMSPFWCDQCTPSFGCHIRPNVTV